MKILFVTSEATMAGVGGGVTHTHGILSLLESIDEARVERLVLPLPWKRCPQAVRQLRALCRSAFSADPAKTHFILDARGRRQLAAALADARPDLVLLNFADLLPLVAEVRRHARCALISHNVETSIIAGQVDRLPQPLRRLFRREIEKTRRMEQDGARQVGTVIAISEEDAVWYRQNAPAAAVIVISGTFGYPPYAGPRPLPGRPLPVAYLAKMSWWPNRQGAEWFAGTVLPALPEGAVEAHFFGPGTETYRGRHPALRGHGRVDSLDTVWRTGGFTLCPTLDGSGINIKLVESLYNGVPVLATPQACRGLPRLDDPGLAIVAPADWPAFLASERALALAATVVRPETGARFSARRAADHLSGLLLARG